MTTQQSSMTCGPAACAERRPGAGQRSFGFAPRSAFATSCSPAVSCSRSVCVHFFSTDEPKPFSTNKQVTIYFSTAVYRRSYRFRARPCEPVANALRPVSRPRPVSYFFSSFTPRSFVVPPLLGLYSLENEHAPVDVKERRRVFRARRRPSGVVSHEGNDRRTTAPVRLDSVFTATLRGVRSSRPPNRRTTRPIPPDRVYGDDTFVRCTVRRSFGFGRAPWSRKRCLCES